MEILPAVAHSGLAKEALCPLEDILLSASERSAQKDSEEKVVELTTLVLQLSVPKVVASRESDSPVAR